MGTMGSHSNPALACDHALSLYLCNHEPKKQKKNNAWSQVNAALSTSIQIFLKTETSSTVFEKIRVHT